MQTPRESGRDFAGKSIKMTSAVPTSKFLMKEYIDTTSAYTIVKYRLGVKNT